MNDRRTAVKVITPSEVAATLDITEDLLKLFNAIVQNKDAAHRIFTMGESVLVATNSRVLMDRAAEAIRAAGWTVTFGLRGLPGQMGMFVSFDGSRTTADEECDRFAKTCLDPAVRQCARKEAAALRRSLRETRGVLTVVPVLEQC